MPFAMLLCGDITISVPLIRFTPVHGGDMLSAYLMRCGALMLGRYYATYYAEINYRTPRTGRCASNVVLSRHFTTESPAIDIIAIRQALRCEYVSARRHYVAMPAPDAYTPRQHFHATTFPPRCRLRLCWVLHIESDIYVPRAGHAERAHFPMPPYGIRTPSRLSSRERQIYQPLRDAALIWSQR